MEKSIVKNALRNLAMTLALLTLAACGGGGAGGSVQTPSAATYTLSFDSGGNGTLSGTASQTVTQGASSSAVTAVPDSGFHFVSWTEGGSVVGSDATLTVTNVSANHSYIANFAITSKARTTATLKIDLTGTLPASTTIAGADFLVILPADITPAMTNGDVATSVVSLSGTFAGSTLSPQTIYTAATANAPGTLKVTLATSVVAGVTQVGEVATITLQLANNAEPSAGSFRLSGASVIDAALYGTISGMGAIIVNVTLQ